MDNKDKRPPSWFGAVLWAGIASVITLVITAIAIASASAPEGRHESRVQRKLARGLEQGMICITHPSSPRSSLALSWPF